MKYDFVNTILHGTAQDKLKELPSDSVDCCITSPPYWALRDYKTPGQLGLEPTLQEYITKLVDIFGEVRRVLKKSGACWVNMGDTYSNNGGTQQPQRDHSGNNWFNTRTEPYRKAEHLERPASLGIPQKSLCLIPERFAIAMVDAGWILRNKIIWHKPNCMPSSAKDRFTVDWEYLFFFTKSQRYYFETQYEPALDPQDDIRRMHNSPTYGSTKYLDSDRGISSTKNWSQTSAANYTPNPLGRIKRCVWKIATQPFSEAHFATFPPALVKTPLLATCPVEGLVLDPFAGAGTVPLVALQNARNFLGIELNQSYIDMAMERLKPYLLQTRLPV